MKRYPLFALTILAIACATVAVITLTAQTLPATRTAVWTQPDLTSAAVTSFTVTVDGNSQTVPPSACTPAFECSAPVSFAAAGTHTVSVTATNSWGTSDPLSVTVNVIVPQKPAGLTIR